MMRRFLSLVFGVVLTAPGHAAAQQATQHLIDVEWLAAHLRDPDLVLLHVGDRDEYVEAHIPGARFISMRDVARGFSRDSGLILEVLDPEELRAALERFGISDGSRIVVYYGDDWVSPTTRIVFTLHYAGLGARTSILDGGMAAWKAAGHPVTDEEPAAVRRTLSPLRTIGLVVDHEFVDRHRDAGGFALVDGRSGMFYDGVRESQGRRGHIPGAGSFPFTEAVDETLFFKSRAELEALLHHAGVARGDTVIAYCHIGQQATVVLFVARLLGHEVRLYDGSMQDWSARDLPVVAPQGGDR